MSCGIDSGIYVLPCASIGGVSEVYLKTYTKGDTWTYDADNIIDGISSGTASFYAFVQDDQTASLITTPQFNRENLAVGMQTALSIKAYELDEDKLNHFRVLSKAPIAALIKSNAGIWYMAGADTAGRATEGLAQLGLANTDHNGWVLTFTWNNQNGVYKVEDTLIGATAGIALIES